MHWAVDNDSICIQHVYNNFSFAACTPALPFACLLYIYVLSSIYVS